MASDGPMASVASDASVRALAAVERRGERRRRWLGLMPVGLLLALFLVGPLLLLIRLSLYAGGGKSGYGIGSSFYTPGTWTLDAYVSLLGDETFREIAGFTVGLGVGVSVLCLVVGYPLALFIPGLLGWRGGGALVAVVLPKFANVLVIVYGLVILLGTSGPVAGVLRAVLGDESAPTLHHDLASVVIGKVFLILPYPVLVLVAAFDRIDPLLAPAARGLGASGWQVWWRVTFPLSLSGLSLAALLSLIWALGAFVTPYLMGSPEELTLAVQVQRLAFEHLNWPGAAATAVMMTALIGACAAGWSVAGRWRGRGV